jgi:transglutaminase-like putative cysteine protease
VKYHITHTTEYSYGEAVPLCHNIIRLRPRQTDRQLCTRHELIIHPEPAVLREHKDYFGNHMAVFSLQEPHAALSVMAISEVEISPACPMTHRDAVPWELAARRVRDTLDHASLDALQYVFDSTHAMRTPELADYARTCFPKDRPLLDAVTALNEQIHRDIHFQPGVTTVSTSATEVLSTREGVCQDFSHLMIGCLRSLGLPARYVSGYLNTHPPPGSPKLVGADASHAWVSVWAADLGWVDFDPTNGLLPDDQHVTVGWARDYDDVGPVKGVILGGPDHLLRVAVDVRRVDDE